MNTFDYLPSKEALVELLEAKTPEFVVAEDIAIDFRIELDILDIDQGLCQGHTSVAHDAHFVKIIMEY